MAKREPAATFPIPDCIKAAADPPAIPAELNPIMIGIEDITQTTAPATAKPFPTSLAVIDDFLFWFAYCGI